jgi:hypothetical protein
LDREHVAERLRQANAEGRLLTHELEERLEAAFSARTYGELDGLVADLPRPAVPGRHAVPMWIRAALAVGIVLAVLVVVAAVTFLVAGLLTVWVVWLLAGWFFFGRARSAGWARRASCPHPRARSLKGGFYL